jgi:hypothetical protein
MGQPTTVFGTTRHQAGMTTRKHRSTGRTDVIAHAHQITRRRPASAPNPKLPKRR